MVEYVRAEDIEDPNEEFSQPYSTDTTSDPQSGGIALDKSQNTATLLRNGDSCARSRERQQFHCQNGSGQDQDQRNLTRRLEPVYEGSPHRDHLDSTEAVPPRKIDPSYESEFSGDETIKLEDHGYGSESDEYRKQQLPNSTEIQEDVQASKEYNEGSTPAIYDEYLRQIMIDSKKAWKKESDLAYQINFQADMTRLHAEYGKLLDEKIVEFKKDYDFRHYSELRRVKDENVCLAEAKNNWMDQEAVIKDLRSSIHQLQAEALAAVDRFQPEEDTFFISAFEKVDAKISPLATLLTKQNSTISNDEWFKGARDAMMNNVRPSDAIDETNKEVRKQMHRSMIWKYLMQHVFITPFRAFTYCTSPELKDTAKKLEGVYKYLWPRPNQDNNSTKWRSTTATTLMLRLTKSGRTADYVDIIAAFNDTLSLLGYPSLVDMKDKRYSGQDKLIAVLNAAVDMAQKCATQRAIFDIRQPSKPLKSADSKYITSKQHDEEEERAGEIQFAVRPMFLKWGTGKGENLCVSTVMAKSLVQLE